MRFESDLPNSGTLAIDDLRQKIALLTAAHGYRDPFTIKHQSRVADLAVVIGGRLGLGAQKLEILRLSAIVHDIGKIAVPSEILGKPGALTDPEYALVQTHCIIGRDILEHLQTPFPVSDIVCQHHERLDGSGYPHGLSGSGILVESRILAVADVYDAMISNRAYRPGLPRDFVLGEMQKMAGRQLDADAVDACRKFALAAPSMRSDAQTTDSVA
jgi:putative two-component system response regulator